MTNTNETENLEILIVEDREENRNAAREAFAKIENVTLDFATNYEEAIEKMPQKPYAAAIIDLEFPRTEGATPEKLGDKLIEETKKEYLPAVILTGGYFHGQKKQARIFFDAESVYQESGQSTADKTDPCSWTDAYNTFSRGNLEMVVKARGRRLKVKSLNKEAEK